MKYTTKSEKQTFSLGKKIAKSLKGGEVLALTGELGAGKTIFAKGLAAGLGVKKIVTSPSFILMNVYKIRNQKSRLRKSFLLRSSSFGGQVGGQAEIRNLVHIDCYRLTDASELKDIGATEYFGQSDTVVVIEWAEKVKRILPKNKLNISIKILAKGESASGEKSQNTREISILKP